MGGILLRNPSGDETANGLLMAIGIPVDRKVPSWESGLQSAKERNMALQLSSRTFLDGQTIPRKFTCSGADVSPELAWSDAPSGTKSLALIVDDPDAPAGVWVHWVLYDLPAETRDLPEGMPKDRELRSGARQGKNDFGKIGYNGPCPPSGPAHRYFFKLYALREKTGLKAGASKDELERAMKGNILGQATLTGKFGR
jgi:Raf kinase inhibitor-like YbhB/YbcL family protein